MNTNTLLIVGMFVAAALLLIGLIKTTTPPQVKHQLPRPATDHRGRSVIIHSFFAKGDQPFAVIEYATVTLDTPPGQLDELPTRYLVFSDYP